MKRYNTSAKSNGLSRLGSSILCLLVTFWPIAIAITIATTAAAALRLFHLLFIFFFRIFFFFLLLSLASLLFSNQTQRRLLNSLLWKPVSCRAYAFFFQYYYYVFFIWCELKNGCVRTFIAPNENEFLRLGYSMIGVFVNIKFTVCHRIE